MTTIEDLQRQLEFIQKENIDMVTQLGSAGKAVDTTQVLITRLEVLLDSIFDLENRLKFELKFEMEMNGELTKACGVLNKSKLLQGTGVSPDSQSGKLWIAK